MKLTVKPMYTPLVQLKWHCAPCCVQWVLVRRELKLYDQETIGKYLDMKIPGRHRHLFARRIPLSKKRKDWGAGEVLKKNLIEKFFRAKRIPLSCRTYSYDKISEHKKFILDNLRKGNDIIFSFHWKGLGKRWNYGHVCVLAGLKVNKRPIVIVGDPSQDGPKFWEVNLAKLINAMHERYDGWKRGFYIIKSRKV